MSDRFQSLFEAIVCDDRGRARQLVEQDADLAKHTNVEGRYESSIAHWIYAGDTALHVAAAGYRLEIARMTAWRPNAEKPRGKAESRAPRHSRAAQRRLLAYCAGAGKLPAGE